MGTVDYKKFTKDEEERYNNAIEKLRLNMKQGLSLEKACGKLDIKDKELLSAIIDDFIKISIAELHYTKHVPLQEVADRLSISIGRINTAHTEMMEDVKNASISAFHKEGSKAQA